MERLDGCTLPEIMLRNPRLLSKAHKARKVSQGACWKISYSQPDEGKFYFQAIVS